MIQLRKEQKWSFRDFLCLFLILSVYAVFNIILADKFFPVSEGWFQDYANYILDGQVPYRDFYMFVPPLFPLLMTLISSISGGLFIAFRIFGIIERMVLIFVVFCLLRKLFDSRTVFISLLTGAIVYISNTQEIFYGYYQTSLLWAIILLYFAVKVYERFEDSCYRFSVLFGVTACLTMFIKHTTGIILFGALFVALFALNYRRDKKRCLTSSIIQVASFAVLTAVFLIVASCFGALKPMMEQLIFGAASSKGSLLEVLVGFIPRITNIPVIFCTMSAIAALCFNMVYFEYIEKRIESKKTWCIFLKLTLSAAIFAIIPYGFYRAGVVIDIRAYTIPAAALLLLTGVIFIIHSLLGGLSPSSLLRADESQYRRVYMYTSVTLSVLLIALFLYIFSNNENYITYLAVRQARQTINYSLFFLGIPLTVYLFIRIFRKPDKAYGILFLLVLSAWIIMYIHGLSYTIEDHAMLLSLSLCLCLLLSMPFALKITKNLSVYCVCFLLIFSIFVQRCSLPYWWWGVNKSADVYSAAETYEDPLLKGLYGSKDAVSGMNKIYHLIENNKRDRDTLYTFPHMNYFNVMSSLQSTTFAKVHYFDVCSDEVASNDAEYLLKNEPTFIIWLDFSEVTWEFHEKVFRGKARSGQRDLLDTYNKLTASGDYILLWEGKIDYSNLIHIWGIDDGREYDLTH